ncbi:MAG: hypothetical protein IT236_16015 [Bacteroidia bacterium]|nr:hypothetical protein [Bacteroidia bacterium]
MKKTISLMATLVLCGLLTLQITRCGTKIKSEKDGTDGLTAMAAAPVATLSNALPSVDFMANQQTVADYAWQLFIALNWKASAYPGPPDTLSLSADFGNPGDYSPVVFDTYRDVNEVFGDSAPNPWTQGKGLLRAGANTALKKIHMLSKSDNGKKRRSLRKAAMAAGSGSGVELMQAQGYWLTDQDSNLIWYEVKINEDEFKFIYDNQLYDSTTQVNYAKKNGIWLPDETSDLYTSAGAIEIKSAWRKIPDNQLSACMGKYKIVKAMIPTTITFDKNNNSQMSNYQPAYLGLIGLHIIRKVSNFPQFTWATFEHVELAPTEGDTIKPNANYLLFNKSCQNVCGTASPQNCLANQSPIPNVSSLKNPVQVIRCKTDVPNDPYVNAVNSNYQQKIKAANPNSVYQYYKLVSTQWPMAPVSDPLKPQPRNVPLQVGGITPATMGNVAAETYALNKGCMSCHQYGNSLAQTSGTHIASDYSFIFGMAQNIKKGKQ